MEEVKNTQEPDWAKIRAEYLNSGISLPALAQKYGVPKSTLQKRSAAGGWSEKRKKLKADKAEKVSSRLHERDVRQTVKDIERVCRAAGKLIDQCNKAIAQVGKGIYISEDAKDLWQKEEEQPDGGVMTSTVLKRKIKTRRYDTLIDTKKLSDISKTLMNVKQVLTGEDGSADDTEDSGGIVMVEQQELDPREGEEDENGLEAAAEAGGDDGEE